MSEGASANERFISACRDDNLDLFNEILEDPTLNINCMDRMGTPGLHISIQQKSSEIFEKLILLNQIDLNIKDKVNNNTPLHIACKESQTNVKYSNYVVQHLLENGANPKLVNKFNQKPIDLLASENTEEIKQAINFVVSAADLALDVDQEDEEEDSDDEGASSD